MPDYIPHLRVFISSRGDVTQERQMALEVIKRLANASAIVAGLATTPSCYA